MISCSEINCGRPVRWRGMCCTHYERWRRTGCAGGEIKRQNTRGSGSVNRGGYVVRDVGGAKKLEHVLIAERAIGRELPPLAEVHHIDENPSNNAPTNLVICPDAAYHKLLHQRQRAFAASGHYDWRRCHICKRYDDPSRMWVSRKKAHHRECDALRASSYRAQLKEKTSASVPD